MNATAASSKPIRPRARGPVQLIFEVSFGVIFIAMFAWFVGLLIEVVGVYTIWKKEGVGHSHRIVQQDLGYIAAAPRSLLVDDTTAFAKRLIVWIERPYQRLGVLHWYEHMHAQIPVEAEAAAAKEPSVQRSPFKKGLGRASRSMGRTLSQWAVISMYVAQDVALRLSVAVFALPAFALACLVGVVDGLVRRDLRRWRGGRESSFVYHHAKRYTGWALTGGFGLYLTWPFGGFNPAYMVLIFTVLVAATLSTTVAAFKKYV